MATTLPQPGLTTPDHDDGSDAAGHDVVVRWCPVGAPTEVRDLDPAVVSGEGTWWLDIGPYADPRLVLELLRRLDPDLPEPMVHDLLEPDEMAKVEQAVTGTRNVSMVGVVAEQVAGSLTGQLRFQPVETLTGHGWFAVCWQPSQVCTGTVGRCADAPVLRAEVTRKVQRAWATGTGRTSGDLATLVARALVQRYRLAHREVESWVHAWELAVADVPALKRLLATVNESRRRVAAFDHARDLTDDESWFPGVTDRELVGQVREGVERARRKLDLLFDTVRADMELVCMVKMVEQAETAQQRAEAEGKFQDNLGKVTALLLVPTLIAGIFGANTRLPGGGSWTGFDAMVALMVVTSLVVYQLVVRRPR
jgi:hypothetical protein